MALKLTDKLKGIDLSKASNMLSGVTSSISNSLERRKEADEHTIDSVDSLTRYLQQLQPDASPSVVMALQSQLQMLKFIQSPTMTLMAIDNIMVCLHKGLQKAEHEEAKESLREVFTSLLQSFIFATEARLRYEIESNREESVRLLADAGDLLMSSVSSTAMMVVPVAAGVKMGHTLPKMVNVLASNAEQKSFLGRLILAKGKKTVIEEKKQEFDKTLNYIFETLDQYGESVGPSIQLHGMLKRYADRLVENYALAQYSTVAKSINEKEDGRLNSLLGSVEKTVMAEDDASFVHMLFSTLSQATKSPTKHDYESVRNIKRSLQSELKNYEMELAKIDADIANTTTEIQGLSMLQFSRKGLLQQQLDTHLVSRRTLEATVLDCQQRITIVGDIIDPVNEKVEQYSNNLYRIVKKFEYNI
jgi:hypothetical protein